MVRIEGFQGMQYLRDGTPAEQRDYAFFNEQYATSSHGEDHDMHPNMVIHPKDDEDVIRAVKWATANNVAVAVRSGGHQYSGASSTSGQNIQLDLRNTYEDLMIIEKAPEGITKTDTTGKRTTLVYAGVSNQLKRLNEYLTSHGLFVPHGVCATVCVGGHAQTGGYGQMGRGFGLFGDHVRAIRLVCHDGVVRDVTPQSDRELFWAICGGSPGNFGVVTHYTLEVYRASEYMGGGGGGGSGGGDQEAAPGPNGFRGPHGIKALWIYSEDVLKSLLSRVAEMADDENFPPGFDLCVNVISTEFPITYLFPSLKDASVWEKIQDRIKSHFADGFLEFLNGKFPASIILYASWCPTTPEQKYDDNVDAWFAQFRELKGFLGNESLQFAEFDMDMARMSGQWIMDREREFDLPYLKRAYTTRSRSLVKDGWVDAVADRIDMIYNEKHYLDSSRGAEDFDRFVANKLVVQIQVYGGKHSQFWLNRDNGTSYSGRDATVLQILDCFYDPAAAAAGGDDPQQAKRLAESWQAENDRVMTGPGSPFSRDEQRKLIWASYGDWNLGDEQVWTKYYDSREVYERIGRVRARADPNGTFTPNPFAVTRMQ